MKRNEIEKRLKVQEKVRTKKSQRVVTIQCHYPAGATVEQQQDALAAAKAAYCQEHPNTDPKRPVVCLGLAYDEPSPEDCSLTKIES